MKILLSNEEIYNYTLNLSQQFNDEMSISLPSLINFAIEKNFKTLSDLFEPIQKTRMNIGKKYGKRLEDGSYQVEENNFDEAQKELENLMSAQQAAEIKMIKLSDLTDIKLTSSQMRALLFMIEEE